MKYDAIIIGSGPNGLAAGIKLAQQGLRVKIYEAKDTVGGGARTAELTLPGFKHDICSAILPLGFASPFFKTLPLSEHGLEWVHPPLSVAHPFEDETAIAVKPGKFSDPDLRKSLKSDYAVYKKLVLPIINNWEQIEENVLSPLRFPPHPFQFTRFGLRSILPAESLVKKFKNDNTKSFFLGMAAHGVLPLDNPLTSAIGLVLLVYAHKYGWPFPKGGTHSLTDALVSYFNSLGGEIETNYEVKSFNELPEAKAYLFDTIPKTMLKIAGDKFPKSYALKLNKFKHGAASFKLDYALDAPIPWKTEACRKTATVHLGAYPGEIIDSEVSAWKGETAKHPMVILAQQSLFDETRATEGKHTAWAYCHIPNVKMLKREGKNPEDENPEVYAELIENQIERFAPGFRKHILAKSIITPGVLENYNSNYFGGDITGGAQTWDQLFTRPTWNITPYRTSAKGIYICSSSTPPGGGVHGMCGFHAAETVIKDLF